MVEEMRFQEGTKGNREEWVITETEKTVYELSQTETWLVTDKKYYMDNGLKQLLEVCIRRHRRKWDNLLIIDGDERSGKSTLAKAIGYYYAYRKKQKFSLNNIFFDLDELVDFAINNKNEIIIWDESALGGMSTQWQSKMQQKLIQLMMIAGKYGHFFVFIIPSFFKLNWYLAVHRSLFLIHIYSRDMVSRGGFSIFNKRQKNWIYNNNKKSNMYSQPTMVGCFHARNTYDIVDEEEYERKKDEAIKKYMKKTTKTMKSIEDKGDFEKVDSWRGAGSKSESSEFDEKEFAKVKEFFSEKDKFLKFKQEDSQK